MCVGGWGRGGGGGLIANKHLNCSKIRSINIPILQNGLILVTFTLAHLLKIHHSLGDTYTYFVCELFNLRTTQLRVKIATRKEKIDLWFIQ